jgi:hypothetical protein
MLTNPVPPEVSRYSHLKNVIVDCGDYCAVKREGQDWQMERKRSHGELEADFYRTTQKAEMLDTFRREWNEEYRNNIRDEKIREDRREKYITGYIGSPFLFDRDMAYLGKFAGELSPEDEAWIKNTREVIQKYHALYEAELQNDFFKGNDFRAQFHPYRWEKL